MTYAVTVQNIVMLYARSGQKRAHGVCNGSTELDRTEVLLYAGTVQNRGHGVCWDWTAQGPWCMHRLDGTEVMVYTETGQNRGYDVG